MKKIQSIGLSLFALVSLGACSDQGSVTGVSAPEMRARAAVIPTGTKICSADGVSGWVATPQNPNWAAPPTGAIWVGKTPTSSTNRTKQSIDIYISQFEIPAGATNIAIAGAVLADNQVLVAANPLANDEANSIAGRFFSTFTEDGTPSGHVLPVNQADNSSFSNFQTVGGKAFAEVGAPLHGGTNNVVFVVYNDDAPDDGGNNGANVNPSGLAFCYVVSYDTPAPLIPMFVIGDVEAHNIGANVNFWGSQWWKNNFMSGTVSNGVASFKGYATQAGTCGGTWVSLPGNSSNPPATIPDQIAVIVTSKVLKQGNNISGDIKQIVIVNHDGNYQDNPGHHGNGPVVAIQCTAP